MRITQGYLSKSVDDFQFLSTYELHHYNDRTKPVILFGMYRYEDLQIAINHKSFLVIMWCGQDAMYFNDWDLVKHAHHVTYHHNIYKLLKDKIKIHLLKVRNFEHNVTIAPMGDKIYAYAPTTAPSYHGIDIINQLKTKYDIIIGDGTIPQHEWRAGRCNEFYNPSFIGLMLSPFAGGGSSIVEMGVRGRRVVTNVFEMPHTIKWNTIEDVEAAIIQERKNIGLVNQMLADEVKKHTDNGEFLYTEFYN